METVGLTSPGLPWCLVLEDRSRRYTARDKQGLQPRLLPLPSCHHLLAVTRSGWGRETMTAQCVWGGAAARGMLAEAGQGILWVLLVPGRHGCWGRHRELSLPAVDLKGPQVIRVLCRRTCTSSNRRGLCGGVILSHFFPSLPSLPGVCLQSPFHLPPFWPLRKQSLIIRRTTVQDLRGWLISPLPCPRPQLQLPSLRGWSWASVTG